ncbi:MAG: hypothetical protein M5T61_14380 [Acidimicrobiia bacterium]|nr:hypothetical protein [Acidimicrobiia bacterium]
MNADAPPFLVVHGTGDSLATFDGAVDFVDALRDVSHEPVAFVALRGAQHAFEIFHSLRTDYMVRGVERFLTWANDRYRAESRGDLNGSSSPEEWSEEAAATGRVAASDSA